MKQLLLVVILLLVTCSDLEDIMPYCERRLCHLHMQQSCHVTSYRFTMRTITLQKLRERYIKRSIKDVREEMAHRDAENQQHIPKSTI